MLNIQSFFPLKRLLGMEEKTHWVTVFAKQAWRPEFYYAAWLQVRQGQVNPEGSFTSQSAGNCELIVQWEVLSYGRKVDSGWGRHYSVLRMHTYRCICTVMCMQNAHMHTLVCTDTHMHIHLQRKTNTPTTIAILVEFSLPRLYES